MYKINFKFKLILFLVVILITLSLLYYILIRNKNVYKLEKKRDGKIKIAKSSSTKSSEKPQEIEIEESDLMYYQQLDRDIDKEFKLRSLWYERPKVTQHIDNLHNYDLDFDNLPLHLLMELDNHQGVDHQNVHDTYVQNSIKNIYHNNTSHTAHTNEHISLHPEVDKIIEKIRNRNSYISNLDDYEYNVLLNTYNQAINNENIRENLIWQLKDCMNGDYLYCPTGVTSRIVASLAIEDPEQLPKDKNTVNTEVLAKFSALTQKYPETDKQDIKGIILQDYPETKTQELVSACIDEWIEHI